MDRHGMEKLKFFRHAVPEAVNLLIDHRRKSERICSNGGQFTEVPFRTISMNCPDDNPVPLTPGGIYGDL